VSLLVKTRLIPVLRKEWEGLAREHPDRLDVRFVLDKPEKGWTGETGFITSEMINKVFPKTSEKVMAFVCGPPPQVNSLAGPKDGPRQGELKGAFKDLGYTAEEVYKF
jgi:NAD(P)H-flavin reductase